MLLLVTPPAEPVVSLAEIKRHVRATEFDDDDDYLQALVVAATGLVDGPHGWLGRALVAQTWAYVLDKFPTDRRIYLPLAPTTSITSVAYTDTDGNSTPFTAFEALGLNSTERAYLTPEYGESWPTAQDVEGAVTVTFVAGYGAASSVPKGIKQAIMLMVGHWYENREDVGDSKLAPMPMASEALLMPYRVWPS